MSRPTTLPLIAEKIQKQITTHQDVFDQAPSEKEWKLRFAAGYTKYALEKLLSLLSSEEVTEQFLKDIEAACWHGVDTVIEKGVKPVGEKQFDSYLSSVRQEIQNSFGGKQSNADEAESNKEGL